MEHRDHVNLLRKGIEKTGGVWADFGSGGGAFTLALRELVGAEAEIYSIDQDRGRLREQERAFGQMFPGSKVHYVNENLSRDLKLPPLDGAVMANVLHFFRNQQQTLEHIRTFLKPNASLIVVEYNSDRGNMWVPHPMTFQTFQRIAQRAGFENVRLLATQSSRFLDGMYAAGMTNPR